MIDMKQPLMAMGNLDNELKSMKLSDLARVVNASLVKQRIQQYYEQDAAARAALMKFKERNGYCTLGISCMKAEGSCTDHKEGKPSPFYLKPYSSTYGKVRKEEKELAARKRARRKSHKKTTKRKAA